MAVVFERAPDAVSIEARRGALIHLRNPVHEDPTMGPVKLTRAVPLWRLPVEAIAGAQAIESAAAVGWRCFILRGGGVTSSVDILDSNGVPRFSHILRGAMLRANVRALVAAEEEAGREEASARILLVPELFFAAVWLIQGRRNLFVAIERDMMSSSSELRRRLLPRFRRLRERSLRSENG